MKKIDKKTILAIILVFLAVAVLFIDVIYKKTDSKQSKVKIVTNVNDFYTVSSCITRFFSYFDNQESDNLILLINDNYKKKNNITVNNVLDLFNNIPSYSNYNVRKMFYSDLDNGMYKYYVSGYINNQVYLNDTEIVENEIENSLYVYFIVYIDKENGLFSIEPYDGEIFIQGE